MASYALSNQRTFSACSKDFPERLAIHSPLDELLPSALPLYDVPSLCGLPLSSNPTILCSLSVGKVSGNERLVYDLLSGRSLVANVMCL